MGTENKIYTAADFARYYSGKMPVAEMHALERDALNDPFLADALDGYQHSLSPVAESEKIHKRLQARVAGKTKNNQKGLWLKIAAMFVVMAGLGYFVYQQNNNNTSKQYAQNEQKAAVEDKLDTPTAESAALSPAAENNNMPSGEAQADQIIGTENSLKSNSQNQLPAITSKEDKSAPVDKSVADAAAPKGKVFEIQGKVTNQEGKGLAGAKVSAPVVSAEVTTDSNGRFYLQSDTKDVVANISSEGYASKSKILNAKNEESVVLQQNAATTKMIAENAKAMARKKTSSAPVQVVGSNAMPEGGLEKFAAYIKEKATPVYDAAGNKISGRVILQFYLNENGKPENITIKKSLCSNCDLQALQLLKNGVRWMGETNKLYQTEIAF